MSNFPNTILTCMTTTPSIIQNEFYGNRGITLIKDQVLTSFINLQTATPSANAASSILNQALYQDTGNSDVTVWLRGFFYPQTSSNYEFTIVTNGNAILMLSNNTSSTNKTLISSRGSTALVGKVYLQAFN